MINILPYKQSDSSRCGPASIKMILNYYGIDALENTIAKYAKCTYEKGCTNQNMVVAIKKYGLGARIYDNCELKDIEYWIKHHIPVIVDWFAGGANVDDISMGHSSIVVDIDRETIYLMDPSVGQMSSIKREEFNSVWFDWHSHKTISTKNLVARQIIVVFPKRLIE